MPTVYARKNDTCAKWTEAALKNAVKSVRNGTMGVNEAAKKFAISKTTLKDRIRKSNTQNHARLGPSPCLEDEAEMKLVKHI